ncbi:hypothetical protein TNCV_2300911 [Trichonephila clavipes]|nr:hypothetical protein TNCV_2300911 [Trichonephila clavipes]
MALDNQTDMDFTPQSPLSTASNGTAPTPCEKLSSMKIYIRRLQIICNEKERERTVSLLRQDKGHDESDSLYQLAWNEYQDVQSFLQQAVSDFDSPPCTKPGCSHHVSPKSTPKNTPPPSPTRRNYQHKRKDDDDFEFPPIRKTARKTILQEPEEIGIENQYSLFPNVIIKQVDTIKKIYPHLRLEYIKLYSNTTEQNRVVRQTLIQLGYRFYVITPKNECPIKVVIKGFPKKADPEDIKKDLENEGFELERVTQLIGRRTKQKLPIFQVTLPRTIENLKIFDLKLLPTLT